jgi:hypothetical protein
VDNFLVASPGLSVHFRAGGVASLTLPGDFVERRLQSIRIHCQSLHQQKEKIAEIGKDFMRVIRAHLNTKIKKFGSFGGQSSKEMA